MRKKLIALMTGIGLVILLIPVSSALADGRHRGFGRGFSQSFGHRGVAPGFGHGFGRGFGHRGFARGFGHGFGRRLHFVVARPAFHHGFRFKSGHPGFHFGFGHGRGFGGRHFGFGFGFGFGPRQHVLYKPFGYYPGFYPGYGLRPFLPGYPPYYFSPYAYAPPLGAQLLGPNSWPEAVALAAEDGEDGEEESGSAERKRTERRYGSYTPRRYSRPTR